MDRRREGLHALLECIHERVDAAVPHESFAHNDVAIEGNQPEAVFRERPAETVNEKRMDRRLRSILHEVRDTLLELRELFGLAARALGKEDQDLAAVERLNAAFERIVTLRVPAPRDRNDPDDLCREPSHR